MTFIIIALLLTFLSDIYIWSAFVRGSNILWSILYFIPLILIVLSLSIGFFGGINQSFFLKLFFVLLLCIVIPKLLFTVISVSGKGIGLMVPQAPVIFNFVGIVVVVCALATAIYGFTVGWKKLTINNIDLKSDQFPASCGGYTVVQVPGLPFFPY